MRMTIPARLAALSCALCAAAACTTTSRSALNCAEAIGPSLRGDVAAPPLPGPSIGEIAAHGDAAVGQLEVANGRNRTVVEIVDWCAEQQRKLESPWWRLWKVEAATARRRVS